ncbi:MAG: tight adherence protein B [Planctomycetota bacterium]|jgi:tight adherence protein B
MTTFVQPLQLALTLGLSCAMIVYSLRASCIRRFERDVAWLEHTLWRFSPSPKPARPYVTGAYIFAFALLLGLLVLTKNPILSIIVWTIVVVIPRLYAGYAWKKRRKQIDEQLSETVRQLSSSVGSGLSLAQAIERLAVRAPHPIRTEFFVISNYWKMGADFETSIQDAKRRLELENFNLFASAIIVNHHMGGNVTSTLDRLASSLESIARMRRDIYAATAEGRMNIKVLAVAPAIMLALVSLMDAEAVKMLFTRPVGQAVLGVCIALTATGTWWAWQIVKSDV